MIRWESIARLLLTVLFMYLFTLGVPWSSILVWARYLALGVIALCVSLWLFVRWRGNWEWYRTPLDPVFVVWGVVFVISILLNSETWRRSFIALWYMLLYAGVWYVLTDVIANHGIRRAVFGDGLLMGGLVVVLIGYYQLRTLDFDILSLNLLRPSSTMGNANILGAFLVILLAYIIMRFLVVRVMIARLALTLYGLLVLGLLFMTFSRGAWFGMLGMFGVMIILLLGTPTLTRDQVRVWLRRNRALSLGVAVSLAAIFLIVTVVFVQSLSIGGRSLSRRTYIYEDALKAFTEKPLAGHGLFTFGQELMRMESMPPELPHMHAHNLVLHVAAELGILGLAALAMTLFVLARALQTVILSFPNRERASILGGIAAIAGMTTHQLVDMPVVFPVIALLGILSLALAITPVDPVPLQAQWRRRGHPVAMVGIWTVLLVTGVWSVNVYAEFNSNQFAPFDEEGAVDFRTAAEGVQAAINADPAMTWYSNQQGYLYGLAAHEGDETALEPGIDAYRRYLETDLQDAVALSNLAALYWQADQQAEAIQTMQQATQAAPRAWQLWFGLGLYAEQTGNLTLAHEAFDNAITDASYLLPAWSDSQPRREAWTAFEPNGFNRVVLALINGTITPETEVDALFIELDYRPVDRVADQVLRALTALAQDDLSHAEHLLDEATGEGMLTYERAWVAFGRAEAARVAGNSAEAAEQLQQVRELLAVDALTRDYPGGLNVPHLHFQRSTIPRQFLPQVLYPTADAALLRLLAERDN